jgi:flagellar biogenesis protein FliO
MSFWYACVTRAGGGAKAAAVAALLAAACLQARAEPPTTQPAPATQPAPTTGAAPAATQPVAGRAEEGTGILKLKEDGSVGAVWQMLAYTLILLVLAAVGIFLAKRFIPKIGMPTGKNVRVLETVHLGSRKTVHLLRVGSRKYLVGSSRERITLLADVTEAAAAETPAAPEEGADDAKGRFARELRKHEAGEDKDA